MKKKWVLMDKALIRRSEQSFLDEDSNLLKEIFINPSLNLAKESIETLKKRKLIELSVLKYYSAVKGPEFGLQRTKKPTDLTAEMIQTGSWKNSSFKAYNYNALGKEIPTGNLHPLLKVRTQFREILLEMGYFIVFM